MMGSTKNKFVIVALALVFFSACKRPQSLNLEDYKMYVNSEESELVTKDEIEGFKYSCKLIPPALQIAQTRAIKNEQELEKELDQNRSVCFSFLIQDEAKEMNKVKHAVYDKELFADLLSYANSELVKDFTLITEDGRRIPGAIVHLEPANSVAPIIRLTVGFEGIDLKESTLTLQYDDKIFNNGIMNFKYSKETLTNLPKLKIQA
jgi:hypothetical protein